MVGDYNWKSESERLLLPSSSLYGWTYVDIYIKQICYLFGDVKMGRLDPQSHVLYQAGGLQFLGLWQQREGMRIALWFQRIGIGKLEGYHRYTDMRIKTKNIIINKESGMERRNMKRKKESQIDKVS
jgi:hypothetical protein